jgi:Fur family ferric uptake transcriptional regulator
MWNEAGETTRREIGRWEAALTTRGYRVTAPRRRILEAVRAQPASFTAEQLADELRVEGIGRATVFRVLELLQELQFVHRLHLGSVHVYAACPPEHHHHIMCSLCGRVDVLQSEALEHELSSLAHARGFTIDEHHLEFVGRCDDCRSPGYDAN